MRIIKPGLGIIKKKKKEKEKKTLPNVAIVFPLTRVHVTTGVTWKLTRSGATPVSDCY